jgi:hypothetical protein
LREPGLSKLESSLIKQGILSRGQVVNPIFLEESFGILPGWIDSSQCRPATELLEKEERHLATRLTPRVGAIARMRKAQALSVLRMPVSPSETLRERRSRAEGIGLRAVPSCPIALRRIQYLQSITSYQLPSTRSISYQLSVISYQLSA